MPAAKRRRRASRLPRFVLSVALLGAFALSVLGFLHFTAVVLYRQQHFAPGAEHPADWYAEGCLALAMASLAVFVLSRQEPRPTPLGRVPSARAWRWARRDQALRPPPQRPAKSRRVTEKGRRRRRP